MHMTQEAFAQSVCGLGKKPQNSVDTHTGLPSVDRACRVGAASSSLREEILSYQIQWPWEC